MSRKVVEINEWLNYFHEVTEESKKLNSVYLYIPSNNILQQNFNNLILNLTYMNRIFDKGFGKTYKVDLLYFLQHDILQGSIIRT